MDSSELLESSIQKIGQSLAKRSKNQTPGFFHYRRWTNLLLAWCTRDDQFRVQLFRFVDVLPTLKTDAQFMRMLKEYFGDLAIIPSPLRWLLRGCSSNPLSAHMGTLLLRRQFLKMAETFMAGHSVEDALPVLERLWKTGCGFSIDFLGEATVSEVEADQYCERCLQALRILDQQTRHWPKRPTLEQDHLGPVPRIQLSVKMSALYSQLDPIDPEGSYAGVSKRLGKILDAALRIPAAITFDMEQAELKDLTIQIFMRIFSEEPYQSYPYAGIALQTYLKDSEATLDTLLNWTRQRGTPIHIRVVKGAYWDSETVHYEQRGWPVPVYLSKPETDANYERLTQKILRHLDLIRPAFGTHNLRSLAHAEAWAQQINQPPGACEYQMLFGMAEPLRKAAIESGLRMRVYAPVGELIPGMAYLVRRLLENTSNESFIRKQYEAPTSIAPLLIPPINHNDQSHDNRDSQPSQNHSRSDDFKNEPLTDFSQPGSHSRMLEAITKVKKQLGLFLSYTLPHGVSPSGPTVESVNPSNPNELIARYPTVGLEDIDRTVQFAIETMHSWRAAPANDRANTLFRTADLIRSRRAELAAWEIFETGKPWREADADIAEAIDFLEFYGRQMVGLGKVIRLGQEPGELNHLTYVPRGIALVISPMEFLAGDSHRNGLGCVGHRKYRAI